MRALAALVLIAINVQAFPVPKVARVPDVAGTTWEISILPSEGSAYELILTFRADGKLICCDGSLASHDPGTWTQAGDTVIWTVGQHTTHTGKFAGSKIEGTGSDLNGSNKFPFTCQRREAK